MDLSLCSGPCSFSGTPGFSIDWWVFRNPRPESDCSNKVLNELVSFASQRPGRVYAEHLKHALQEVWLQGLIPSLQTP